MFEQILETGSSRPLKGRSLGGGCIYIYIYVESFYRHHTDKCNGNAFIAYSLSLSCDAPPCIISLPENVSDHPLLEDSKTNSLPVGKVLGLNVTLGL